MGETNPMLGMIPWKREVPDKPPQFREIRSPRPGELLRGIILDSELLAVQTHFYDDRTKPCVGPLNGCMGCHRKLSKRWNCYVGVLDLDADKLAIFHLTPRAARESGLSAEQKPRSLRGLYITQRRPSGKSGGRTVVFWSAVPPAYRDRPVPPAFDVQESLCYIWGHGRDAFELSALPDNPNEGGAQ